MIAGKQSRSNRRRSAPARTALGLGVSLAVLSVLAQHQARAGADPPETTITSGPSGAVVGDDVTFTYAADPAPATFECRLDAAPFATCPATGTTFTDVPSGNHTFEVRAVNAAGADPTPALRAFTVGPPVGYTPPDGIPPDTVLMRKPNKRIVIDGGRVRVKFRFKGLDNVTPEDELRFVCKFDGRKIRGCDSPFRRKVGDGRHRFKVRTVDEAGNRDPTPAKFGFNVVVVGSAQD